MSDLPKVAVFSGPTATIQNTPPLRTTGVERLLRAQRLAQPAVVYVEAFSAHPLESDMSELYAPAHGYLDVDGEFVATNGDGVPDGKRGVYRIELDPMNGPLMLPYVSRMADGGAWNHVGTTPFAGPTQSRQTFYPDASRLYEEIDTFGLSGDGHGQLLSSQADFTFIRALPSSGYTSEHAAAAAGLPAPESRGEDFFGYYPPHLRTEPGSKALVRATNTVQRALAGTEFLGAQWLEGSPTTEESLYWLNLVIDTKVPIVGHSAQRPHGTVSGDGDRNIVDGVTYLTSRIWADDDGIDQVGAVMIVDEVIYAAREVAKTDARPGNYVATGGHGGIVGSMGGASDVPVITYKPMRRHTHRSAVRMSEMPDVVEGVRKEADGGLVVVPLRVKGGDGYLDPDEMPAVEIVKFTRYSDGCCISSELEAWMAHVGTAHRLAGVVGEGKNPYGSLDPVAEEALKTAAFSGLPVAKCGRGNTAGFTAPAPPWFIPGGNLTPTKARILLMACLLRFGALPPAKDPTHPTDAEVGATAAAVAKYREVFNTH
ncbi:MAG TPA: asparaginase domain-containing protein [Acidimicrobiales bacterium]|nr:asparaginase domain-containing protein [Acidimicrobiales bacterium]